jgi:hypothetical protein
MTIAGISIYFSPSASIEITTARCNYRKWLEMYFAEHLNIKRSYRGSLTKECKRMIHE